MVNRDFKGVWIPKHIWLDSQLTMIEKGILTEIDSLDMGEDGCWASNEYLAKFCQCSECKVSLAITKLAKLGYIRVESFDGRRRKIKSSHLLFKDQPFKKSKADFEKVKESNTRIRPKNNLENNTLSRKSASSVIPEDFENFYGAYPRKVGKQSALKAWKALKPDAGLIKTILSDVELRTRTEWKGQDIHYIPYPATYLNQRRWEDETEPTERKGRETSKEGWKNPALDYEQRDYKAIGKDREGKILDLETGEWVEP